MSLNLRLGAAPGTIAAILEAAAREAERREAASRVAKEAAAGERFSMVALAGQHALQLAAMQDLSRRVHIMCARQAGKSWADVGMLIANALARPGTTNLFLGLNAVAVRMNIWEPIVKVIFDRFHDLGSDWFGQGPSAPMAIRFPNGSRIFFGGYDDLRHVKNFLGGRLAGGIVILDEAQDAGPPLDELLDVILPPMLTLTSRLVLSGTIPDAPAGRFYEESKRESWSKHNWGRLANVHTPEARDVLAAYLIDTGLSEEDPQIQRDWYGRAVFDPLATAYRFLAERNLYLGIAPDWLPSLYETQIDEARARPLLYCHPMQADKKRGARFGIMAAKPRDGVDVFSFAIDPGSNSDRASIQGLGWGSKDRVVQHVFDWTTPPGVRPTTGDMFAVAGLANRLYGGPRASVLEWRYDAGSSQNTIDNLMNDYGIAVILAARKTDKIGQVDRMNDVLVQRRMLVMAGSALEQDLQRARWDKKKRATGQYEWASAWHPDPGDAARYALQPYVDGYAPPKERTVFDDPLLKAMAVDTSSDRPRYS